MTKEKGIYKCKICENIIEVLHQGVGQLVCCGEEMEKLEEKEKEEGNEKHLPVIEELPPNVCQGKDGFVIKIGEEEHPMEENHYIEWIEINTSDGKSGKKFLKPGEKPESKFYTRMNVTFVRAYCNVHGLWKKVVNG